MDLFTLRASLGLDTSEYEAALAGLQDPTMNVLSGMGDLAKVSLKWLTKGVVALGKEVFDTGLKVDKSFGAVRAVLGKDGTEDVMEKLLGYGREVAADSIFKLEEVGDAYYYMGMAGWKTEEMLAGLPGVINLAAASGEDLGQVSDIVTDSLTAFGLGAGQAAHFADVLAVTATNSNTDVARMGQTFKYLAPVAGALGYSIEDIATSVGLVANAGIKGSMAGTSLRNIFTRIATNAGATNTQIGAMGALTDELGVSFYDAYGKARPWLDVLTESRAAWKKLDPDKADKVAEAFGNLAVEGQDASEIMADFANDLDVWTTEWNSFTTEAQRKDFVKKYGKQFEALGISMYNSKGKLREFNDVASEARIKLGGLNDEEKLFYANRIGNLRGMTSWLALMNASEADFNQVTQSIENAAGAAQDMANVKLDNLWGDVEMLGSKLNILYDTIYDEVKGPARELVQWATGAIERITAAISANGLAGGVQQLATEIRNAGDTLQPLFESIGEVAAPLIGSLIDTLVGEESPVLEAATKLGSSFAKGFTEGAMGSMINSDRPSLRIIGTIMKRLGVDLPDAAGGTTTRTSKSGGTHSSKSGSFGLGIGEYFTGFAARKGSTGVQQLPAADAEKFFGAVPDAFSKAILKGAASGTQQADATMTTFTTKSGQQITSTYSSAIAEGARQGGEWTGAHLLNGVESRRVPISTAVSTAIADGGNTGGDSASESVRRKIARVAPSVGTTLSNNISSAGNTGGAAMANNINTKVSNKGSTIKDTLATSLGKAGSSAGSDIVSRIQSALSIANFVISVFGTLFGGGNGQHFAKAQNAGRILRGATVFGVSGNGEPLIGGENGPEAVIGTNSLRRMVYDAAGAAVQGVSGSVTINVYQQPGQDSRQLAEAVQKQFVQWEKQRRAVYR